MMTAIRGYARQGRHILRKWSLDPRVHTALRIGQCLFSGFLLSAASLGNFSQPLALGLLCASNGWPAVLIALGGSIGYRIFWGSAGLQGVAWLLTGLPLALLAGGRPKLRTMPLLLPGAAAVAVAAVGLAFQLQLGDTTPVLIYLLRILLAGTVTRLFLLSEQQGALVRELCQGAWVLALAQVAPFSWLSLGFLTLGAIAATGNFPAAALAGLAVDLAGVSTLPITAVACLTYFLRQIPGIRKRIMALAPGAVYLTVMGLCGVWRPEPLVSLVLGGILSQFLPEQQTAPHRRGETGMAQVRLEMTAGVFSQVQQLLLETPAAPIDEPALVQRAVDRACTGCPCRKGCRERDAAAELSPQLLHRPLLDGHDLGIPCRKEGRLLSELHRAQEQLRSIRASREVQRECRSALLQQYQYLSEYLQDLSDELGSRAKPAAPRFKPQVAFFANRPEGDNGDCFRSFPGSGCRYFVLLCDGMGTGLGAKDEGAAAARLLEKLLTAGFPAEYALRSLNSLCALRGIAGAVTVDLLQLQLDTGKALLYKWGAAPSCLHSRAGAEKIGTAGPPPGLSVTEARETVERLSLRRGETLVLCSDGVGGEEALRCLAENPAEPVGELAARILESGVQKGSDDATVAVVRLRPES